LLPSYTPQLVCRYFTLPIDPPEPVPPAHAAPHPVPGSAALRNSPGVASTFAVASAVHAPGASFLQGVGWCRPAAPNEIRQPPPSAHTPGACLPTYGGRGRSPAIPPAADGAGYCPRGKINGPL